MSFELGCVLFELAMCGKHPFPGYPNSFRGLDGLIPLAFKSSGKDPEFSTMKPPMFPLEFCNLIRGLLLFDPARRTTLLDAFRTLENVEPPSPAELLSFYSHIAPSSMDAGGVTYNEGNVPTSQRVYSICRVCLHSPPCPSVHILVSASFVAPSLHTLCVYRSTCFTEQGRKKGNHESTHWEDIIHIHISRVQKNHHQPAATQEHTP
ncbi:hypothetical protein Pelo_19589 [Pelomyxa schiedti]|nr:hypothetical protein Pelo_19589 [Pelomyxa schiedti]